MKIVCVHAILFPLLLSPIARVAAADEFQYFPATPDNTTLADGTALKIVATPPAAPEEITRGPADAEPNNHWHWRQNAGSGSRDKRGLFTAAGQHGNDAPMLRTTVSGLKPRTDYQVFGGFWIGGFSADDKAPTGDHLWDIRLGCGIAAMMGYGYSNNAGLPGTIGCGTSVPWQGGVTDRDGDKRMFGADLGCARTDSKGTLTIYVDDQAEDSNKGRTWYDGIGVTPGAAKSEIGSGAPGALHRAVRCADREMVRRELEAGADLNTVDHDGLTPLFYACITPDLELVAAFLKAGAAPDFAAQTLSPLWVAATNGDAKLTAMLLEAGAKVPPDILPANPQRDLLKDVAQSHPAVAAIGSGSLKVLKMLLDKEPALDLDRLYASAYPPPEKGKPDTRPYPVMGAVFYNHAEMAEFLISIGCQIAGAEFELLPEYAEWTKRSDNTHGTRSLLVAAVMARPPMRGVVDALARRGVKLVDDNFAASSQIVVPWDALTAAALAGDVELTTRLLPSAEAMSNAYKTRLIVLARTSGDAQVMSLVCNRFAEVKMPRWDGTSESDERKRTTDDARVLEPRKIPFKLRKAAKGNKVLAVLSSPDAAGPAAAITAKASAAAGWICVEREQIDTLLREGDLPKPWEDTVQDLSRIGDHLSADLLIIVSRLKADNLTILRLEAVDVRSGLPISRLHLDEKEFKPDAFCADYLAETRRKLDDQLTGETLTAITLLPITVDPNLGGSTSLEGLLHAGLLQKIDQTRGMIALTREQMQPLAEEKTFQQTGKLWGAAWTVEGGLKPLDDNRVELALRLRSLGKDARTHDVKATGSTGDVQSLLTHAWTQLLAAMKVKADAAKPAADDAPEQRAGAEAARLLREAEWLLHIGRPHDAAPLIDAALYLGGDPLKTNLLRMNIHMTMRQYWAAGRMTYMSSRPTQPVTELPVTPSMADRAAHYLGEYLELLRINAETLDRLEKILADPASNATQKGPLQDFWWNLDTLIYYRSMLQPCQMTAENQALLKVFDTELARHLKRLFALLTPSPMGYTTLEHTTEYSYLHFQAVPTLADAMAAAILRLWDGTDVKEEYAKSHISVHDPSFQSGKGLIPNRTGIMCDALEKALKHANSPYQKMRQAEIAFLRSTGEQRGVAARALMRAKIPMLSGLRKPVAEWVSVNALFNWSPMPKGDDTIDARNDITHGDALIPELFHSNNPTPDQIFRQKLYAPSAFSLHSIISRNAWAWQYSRAQFADSLETKLNRTVANSGSAGEFNDILSSARLIDLIYGVDIAGHLEPRIVRIRPNSERKFFGSRNQFPILDFAGTVETKLLVDVRSGVTDKPAMITHMMVDPKKRHVLWMILEPYEDWDLVMDQYIPAGGAVALRFAVSPPWLIAIDCRDGRTLHKINLAAPSGSMNPNQPATTLISNFGNLIQYGMTANDTHLLVQMRWGQQGRVGNLILINRETGTTEIFPEFPLVQFLQMPNSLSSYQPVAGAGGSFFLVQTMEAGGTILWQIKPGEKPIMLTKSGRRPEESPFDAEDLKIRYILNDGGRLLAASSWGRLAHYDPVGGAWSLDPERTEAKGMAYISPISLKAFRATIFPQHLFKHKDGSSDAFVRPSECEPGRLSFQHGNSPLYYLPVRMQPPETYRARFNVCSPSLPGDQIAQPKGAKEAAEEAAKRFEWLSVANMARSNKVSPAICNQTDAHFVLATRLKDTSSISGEAPIYLPFLWIIDKQTMLEGMKQAQQK